jgi:tetratricopeptide (TPR) repeat protein
MSTPLHVMIRFGRWEEILAEPAPPAWRLLSVAQYHYARGVPLSALGRTDEARVEREAFEEAAVRVPEDWVVGANPSKEVLGLARQMLKGELLWREGAVEEAFEAMAEGCRLEDELVYDEPPGWMQPVRHAFGALLMADGRAAEAETIYREDLQRNPGNGWSLLGLQQALAAQGKTDDAEAAAEQLADVWQRADVRPSSSCYCEPGRASS